MESRKTGKITKCRDEEQEIRRKKTMLRVGGERRSFEPLALTNAHQL